MNFGQNSPVPTNLYGELIQPLVDRYVASQNPQPVPQTMPPMAVRYRLWQDLTPDERQQWNDMAEARKYERQPDNPQYVPLTSGDSGYNWVAGMAAQFPDLLRRQHPDIMNWLAAVSGRGHS